MKGYVQVVAQHRLNVQTFKSSFIIGLNVKMTAIIWWPSNVPAICNRLSVVNLTSRQAGVKEMPSYFSGFKINIEMSCYKYVVLNRTLIYNYLEEYVREDRTERWIFFSFSVFFIKLESLYPTIKSFCQCSDGCNNHLCQISTCLKMQLLAKT